MSSDRVGRTLMTRDLVSEGHRHMSAHNDIYRGVMTGRRQDGDLIGIRYCGPNSMTASRIYVSKSACWVGVGWCMMYKRMDNP